MSAAPDPAAGVARRVAVSAVSQLGARVVHLALNVVSTVAVIRYLGPTGFGDFVVVVTVTGWAGLVAEFGLTRLAVREGARDGDALGTLVGTVIVARLALSLAAAACAQIVLLAIGAGGPVHVAAAVSSLLFVTEALLSSCVVFHVAVRQQYEAGVRLLMELVEIAVLVTAIALGAGLVMLFAAPVVGGVVGVVAAGALARARFGLHPQFDARQLRRLLALAAPVLPAVLLGVLTLKLDNAMVAALRSRRETGLYGAAYQPVEYVFLALPVVCYPFFPLLARQHGADPVAFRTTFQWGTDALLALLLPVPVVLAVVARPLVTAVYGPGFAGSAVPLQLLAVALLPMGLTAWHGFVLLAGDRQRLTLRYGTASLLTSFALCLLLIPRAGIAGAAWAALGAYLLSAVWSRQILRRELGVGAAPARAVRVAAAATGLGLVVAALTYLGVPWWAATVLGAATYPLWLVAAGVVGADTWRAIRPAARGGAPGQVAPEPRTAVAL